MELQYQGLNLVAQDGVPSQAHDLVNVVHGGDQTQTDITLHDVLQGNCGEVVSQTKLQGVVDHDVHVEVAAVPAAVQQQLSISIRKPGKGLTHII